MSCRSLKDNSQCRSKTQGVTFQKGATQPLGDDDMKQLGSVGLRLEILERVYRMLSSYCY